MSRVTVTDEVVTRGTVTYFGVSFILSGLYSQQWIVDLPCFGIQISPFNRTRSDSASRCEVHGGVYTFTCVPNVLYIQFLRF